MITTHQNVPQRPSSEIDLDKRLQFGAIEERNRHDSRQSSHSQTGQNAHADRQLRQIGLNDASVSVQCDGHDG